MNAERKRLDYELRARMVFEAIAAAPEPIDIKQICELTGLKRTPYLGNMLEWLVVRGLLAHRFSVRANGYAATVFWAARDWFDT